MSNLNEPQAAAQPTAETPRLLYSYKEAREKLGGVPESTFSLWIAQGLIEPVRIGPRRCFVKHEDVVRLAQGNPAPKGA
jgi:predicted site-specific integrase-resolvase